MPVDQQHETRVVERRTVVRSSRSSRRPWLVTLLAALLLVGGGLSGLLMLVLLRHAFSPNAGLSNYTIPSLYILTLLTSAALCVTAVGLLRRASWSRRWAKIATPVVACCLVITSYYASPILLGAWLPEFSVTLALAFALILVPAVILNRSVVRSWFRHGR